MTKLDELNDYIAARSGNGVAVAFSGGVDSSVLLSAVAAYRRESEEFFPFLAFYVSSVFQSGEDVSALKRTAEDLGAEFVCFHFDPLKSVPELAENPPERCYLCKRAAFTAFRQEAEKREIDFLADGTNADDLGVYRPGRQALTELGILSPFAELGITKRQIRAMAKEMSLSAASKPSTPCLATRFEYGTRLTQCDLERVSAGEAFLHTILPLTANLRLRVHHGDIARIETDPVQFPALVRSAAEIHKKLSSIGYSRITMDLAGFRSGSMDDPISEKNKTVKITGKSEK